MARRQWAWRGEDELLTSAADTLQVAPVLTDAELNKGETIVRLVGDMAIQLVTATTQVRRFGVGFTLVTEATGSGPDPLVDFDADWIWHKFGTLMPDGGGNSFMTVRYSIDNRSMRKVRENEKLIVCVHGQGAPMLFGFGLRVGLKLP